MKTLCLDQSSSCIGFAVLEGDNLLAHGICKPLTGDSEQRINELEKDVIQLIETYLPSEIVIEGHHYPGMQSAESIEPLATVTMIIRWLAKRYGLKLYRAKEPTWKSACGGGRDKVKAGRNACALFGLSYKAMQSNDESDAIGIAAYWSKAAKEIRAGRMK